MSKISLKLDESNDLKFKMNIQGSTSEPGATKPLVRFVVSEKDNANAMGLIFPVLSSDGDTITFTIPALSGVVKVGTTYTGKVEVLIGSRFFVPITLDLIFTKNLSVEVVPVVEEKKESSMDVSKLLQEIETKPTAPTTPTLVNNTNGKRQIVLTKSQLEKMLQEAKSKKPASVPSVTQPAKPAKEALKNLFRDALDSSEEEDD